MVDCEYPANLAGCLTKGFCLVLVKSSFPPAADEQSAYYLTSTVQGDPTTRLDSSPKLVGWSTGLFVAELAHHKQFLVDEGPALRRAFDWEHHLPSWARFFLRSELL